MSEPRPKFPKINGVGHKSQQNLSELERGIMSMSPLSRCETTGQLGVHLNQFEPHRRGSIFQHDVKRPSGSPSFYIENPNWMSPIDSQIRPQLLIGHSRPIVDWSKYYKSDEKLKECSKPLREFYENQNELIERYCNIDRLLDSEFTRLMIKSYGDSASINRRSHQPVNVRDETTPLLGKSSEDISMTVMIAIYVNFALNIILLIGKTVVVLLTNSLSIMASLLDSALDFLSTAIIYVSTLLVGRRDWHTRLVYPVGKSRLEPIGILVFSNIIILSFIQVGIEAVRKLINPSPGLVKVSGPSLLIMGFTVVTKIFAWLWCRQIKSSSVQALAQDAETDVIFNTFSILFPLAEAYTKIWWFDGVGALLLSAYIVVSWARTAWEHIRHLTGATADIADRQVILYLCMRFAETVKKVTNLNAYYSGDRLTVEVDIVVDEGTSLRDSHDIGEALQYAIEALPFVERAFVHIDYRNDNYPGHLEC